LCRSGRHHIRQLEALGFAVTATRTLTAAASRPTPFNGKALSRCAGPLPRAWLLLVSY